MPNPANKFQDEIAQRHTQCLRCVHCEELDEATVYCQVAGQRLSFAEDRCRLRKWPNTEPLHKPKIAPNAGNKPGLLHPCRLIVGVLSSTAEAYQDRRRRCLETWLPVIEAMGVEVVFLIGIGKTNHAPTLKLPVEHGRIGTELHLPCPDDYASLPQKTRGFCQWALAHRSFDYLFKCDDDTYIVPDRLLRVDLSGVDYFGSEWSPGVGYASGGAGYFLSRHAAEHVASELTHPQGAEDQLVGELLRERGMAFEIDPRFVPYASEAHRPKPDNDLVTAHACMIPWEKHEKTWPKRLQRVTRDPIRAFLCLPGTYQRRLSARYFDDTPWNDEYQDGVYRLARALCDQYQLARVVDIGCGSGFKLMKYFAAHPTIGIDLPPTVSWLQKKYPDRQWREECESEYSGIKTDIVICADMIEHLSDPRGLLENIRQIQFKYLVISTPDRIALYGSDHRGPPTNPHHCQEWSRDEFHALIGRFFEVQCQEWLDDNNGSPCQVLVATSGPSGCVDGVSHFAKTILKPCHSGIPNCDPVDFIGQPRPACCTQMMRDTLFRVASMLDEAKVTWWVDYGTLLGAYRHQGEFIPHDWDCDVSVLLEHRGRVEILKDRLFAEGFDWSDDGVIRVFRSPTNRHHTDLFFWERCGDMLELRGFPTSSSGESQLPEKWITPMEKIDVMGRLMPCPNCVPSVLAHRYGDDYMIPKVY